MNQRTDLYDAVTCAVSCARQMRCTELTLIPSLAITSRDIHHDSLAHSSDSHACESRGIPKGTRSLASIHSHVRRFKCQARKSVARFRASQNGRS
jgi:hypothetical protein